MANPTFDDYSCVVQNLKLLAAANASLASSTAVRDTRGLPIYATGSNAFTFKVRTASLGVAALRFFKRPDDGHQFTYEQIANHLNRAAANSLVSGGSLLSVDYSPDGVQLDGKRLPCVTMPWSEGSRLDNWLDTNQKDPKALAQLSEAFRQTISSLMRCRVAHGDLQHGNMLISLGTSRDAVKLTMVDYDGMWVPGIPPGQGRELGHPNYQHPSRTGAHHNEHIDRFSAISIWLGLELLRVQPALRPPQAEHVVFNREHYAAPQHIVGIADQVATLNDDLRRWTLRFANICRSSIDTVPPLDDFINFRAGSEDTSWMSKGVQPRPAPPPPPPEKRWIDAADRQGLAAKVGTSITIRGRAVAPPKVIIRPGYYLTIVSFENGAVQASWFSRPGMWRDSYAGANLEASGTLVRDRKYGLMLRLNSSNDALRAVRR